MKWYVVAHRKLRNFLSWLRVIDLRLRGARVGTGVEILGPVEVGDARGLKIGDGVRIGSYARLRLSNGGRIEIRNGARIGNSVRLESVGGDLLIREKAIVNTASIVTCWSSVSIGASALIAPFCHITDRNHGIEPGQRIFEQRGDIKPITIGDDVWIASSTIVLLGVSVGDGAVVGANSLVNKSIAPGEIAAGSPVRRIGAR